MASQDVTMTDNFEPYYPSQATSTNSYIYEVDPDLQTLAPKTHPSPPSPPTNDLKELYAFENILLNSSYPCYDCGSDTHGPGLCEQRPLAYSPRGLKSMDEVEGRDRRARAQLAHGVPEGAPCCERHANGAVDSLLVEDGDGHTPASSQGYAKQTGLLPLCYPCFVNKTARGHGERPHVTPRDSCLCATAITLSGCWMCAIERCAATKGLIINNLSKIDAKGKEIVTCECGQEVKGSEAVRLCAGCNEVVTMPATNFAGDRLTFSDGKVEQKIIDPAPKHTQLSTPKPQQRAPSGYRSVKDMLSQGKQQTHNLTSSAGSQRNHVVLTAAEVAQLNTLGLQISGPTSSNNVQAALTPRLRLDSIVNNLPQPSQDQVLQFTAVAKVLEICRFDANDTLSVSAKLHYLFSGEVTAGNLGVLVSCALDNLPEPDRKLTGWMDHNGGEAVGVV